MYSEPLYGTVLYVCPLRREKRLSIRLWALVCDDVMLLKQLIVFFNLSSYQKIIFEYQTIVMKIQRVSYQNPSDFSRKTENRNIPDSAESKISKPSVQHTIPSQTLHHCTDKNHNRLSHFVDTREVRCPIMLYTSAEKLQSIRYPLTSPILDQVLLF